MILFHAKRDGTVTTTPDLVPQGSSMQDLVVVSEFDYAYCAIKLLPASGEYIEDTPCDLILDEDGKFIWTAPLPPKATVVAGSVDYQLIFTAADGTTQTTLVGSFTVPRGVPVSTPPTVGELSVKTINDLYTILSNISALFSGHDGDITQNKTDIAQTKTDIAQTKTDIAALKKTVSSAGYVTIPATEWTDNLPTVATVPISGVDMGSIILMLPANETTRLTANNAKLSAYPDAFTPVGGESRVSIFRAEAEKAPDADMTFAYVVIKTEYDSRIPLAAIIGVDAYGEGGAASGVDEEAVKTLIYKEVPEWARAKQKPTYTPEEIKARPATWMPTAKEIGARPSTWMPTAAEVGARPNTWTPTAGEVGAESVGKVKDHNEDSSSHADIRLDITTIRNMLAGVIGTDTGKSMRAVAALVVAEIVGDASDSFDTLEEIAAWIEAHPNDVADMVKMITDLETAMGGTVNKTDIINTLDSTALDKPLSAAMGAKLNAMLTEISDELDGKTTPEQVAKAISDALTGYALKDHNHDGTYAKPADIPTKISQLAGDSTHRTVTDAEKTGWNGKADGSHNHDGVYAKPSDIPTVPQTLPNPYALTILGKTYTGGKAVSLTVEEIMEAIKTASGGVVAYLDGNKLVLSGNLPDATYTAYYEVNGELIEIGDLTLGSITPDPVTYTIKWVNYDGTVLETDEKVAENTVPTYDGATPTRAADNDYTYTFSGWADEKGNVGVVAATANAIYTAVYDKTAKPAEVTNLLPSATDASGNAYNGTQGWKTGYRLSSSSGNESASSGIEVTGFIPVKYGQTIKMENITTADGGTNSICFYNGSRTYITGGYLQAALDESKVEGGIVVNTDAFTNMTTAVAYFRFSATEITTDSVVTVTG